MSKTYVIISASAVSSVDFSQVAETSASTLRYNLDNTKTIVKFTGDSTPSFLTGNTQYTHSEISAILNNTSSGWFDPDEE